MLLFAVTAAPALASTQIGQLGAPYEAGQCAGVAVVQTAVETGTISYEVPAGGGVITSWQTRTGKDAGTVKLKVFRKKRRSPPNSRSSARTVRVRSKKKPARAFQAFGFR